MNKNGSIRVIRVLLSAILAATFTLHPTPVSADDPIPQIGDPVSLDISTPPENSLAFSGCQPVKMTALNANYEQRVVELVNLRRAEYGLPPLKRSADLDFSARYHAKDMMDDDYFSHDTQDRVNNSLVSICTWSERIQKFYPNREYLGENLAGGQVSPESMMEGLMNSEGHRKNILHSSYKEIGVGYMEMGGRLGRYWSQDFGSRSNVYPLIINREALNTPNRQVSLYIYGQGVWNEMRLRNDADAWSAWLPFQTSLGWALLSGTGVHTVSVELRKTGGITAAASSDTIVIKNLPYKLFLPTTRR